MSYTRLSATDEPPADERLPPVAATAVERGDAPSSSEEAPAAAEADVVAPPARTGDAAIPGEVAEPAAEPEGEEGQGGGTGGSSAAGGGAAAAAPAAAAPTREVTCTTTAELQREIGSPEKAKTLKRVKIRRINSGLRAFAEGARELQAQGTMTHDLELDVGDCEWSGGELASLAGLSVSKLRLYAVKGVTSAEVAAFVEGARELQAQGTMTRDLELDVGGCEWSGGELASLAGLSVSKLRLKRVKGVKSAEVAAFAEGARELQAQGTMTRDLELDVWNCEWSGGELASLMGLSVSKLRLRYVSGVKSAEVAAFAEGARKLQAQGTMTRDLELDVWNCEWSVDHLRAALSDNGSSFGSLVLSREIGADGVRVVAKKIADGQLRVTQLQLCSSSELSAFFELVIAIMRSKLVQNHGGDGDADKRAGTRSGALQDITILVDELREKYPAVVNIVGSDFKPMDIPPMQLAVAMAARCKEWAALYASDSDALEKFAAKFDTHAASLLDQCNSPQEAEQLLLKEFEDTQLAGGTMPVLDFALRHDVRSFAANRWVQAYTAKLWTSPDVHFVPKNWNDRERVDRAGELITGLQSTHLLSRLLAVPLLCLGTPVAAVAIVCLSVAGSVIPKLHDTSRILFLGISLAWNTPFIKFSLFAQTFVTFVLIVTTLATTDRRVVSWPELAVYAFGAALLIAETSQLRNGKAAAGGRSWWKELHSWWKELQNHLSGLWNVCDASIIVMIALLAWQRLRHVTVVAVDAGLGGGGSLSAAKSMEQDNISKVATYSRQITIWQVEDIKAGHVVISLLCIVVWLRLLGLMLVHSALGPLIQMVVKMQNDLMKFLVLCVVFVLGFGVSISALLFGDQRSSINSLGSAVHATSQGLLGTQDMEQVTTQWEAEAVFTVYLVMSQVLLLNLLIAMFSSTYERVKEHETDEWRLARAQIILEYSNEVRGVLELPVLNLFGVLLLPLGWLWRRLRRCCPASRKSRVRLPWEEVKEIKVDKGKPPVTQCRSLYKTRVLSLSSLSVQADFEEVILKSRWIQEQEDLLDDRTQIGELDSNANKRHEAMEARVASLEEMIRQQAEQQAKQSNKCLDQLDQMMKLISDMQER